MAVARGQCAITIDIAEFRSAEFTALGSFVGAVTLIRQVDAEVAVLPPASGAYRVLKTVGLNDDRRRRYLVSAIHHRCSPADGAGTRSHPGFDAVVEWQLPEEVLIDLVALGARSPERQEPTGDVETQEAGHGSR